MKTKKNKIYVALLPGFGFFLVFVWLIATNWLSLFQLKLGDNLYLGTRPNKDIVLVEINDKSLDQINGLGHFSLWKRDFFAKVLENINKYDPQLIGIDIFFKSPKDQLSDKQFADALKKTNIPVLVYRSNPERISRGYFSNQEDAIKPLPLFSQMPNMTLSVNNTLPDEDTVIRRVLTGIFNEVEKKFEESFAFAVAKKALSQKKITLKPENEFSEYQLILESGGKLNIPLENGQMMINYFSSPQKVLAQYQKISFADIYNENYFGVQPETLFKNKIVLIGASAPYFNDSYITPVSSNVQMSGVEIHANAIQTILERKFLRNESMVEKSIVLFLLCMGAAVVFMYSKIRWSVVFLAAVSAVYTLSAPFFFNKGIILDLVHPYLALPTVFIASYMYRYLTEFKEKSALKMAFSHYVSPKVAETIMAHPENLKLGGEKREVTVLFSDIVNFTSISEKLQPESLVALLNEYFEAMSQVIFAEGGTLDKFEGDAIMAFFGAPLEQKDQAMRACRAALNMRLKLNALTSSWKSSPLLPGGESKPTLDFRCGLSTGEVIVGNMGSSERFDYTVMGDTVNLGSRLESANKKYETNTMVSEPTYEAVKEAFELRELDIIQVVGKSKPMKVYELLAPKGQLPINALQLLKSYQEGIQLYHNLQFALALAKFEDILKVYPDDGPSKLYRQRCEVLRDFPPPADWNGVFEMKTK